MPVIVCCGLCWSSVVLLHEKPEGRCFMFWDMTGGYKQVSEDGKPAGVVLKDCKRQRAEAGAVSPILCLGAGAGLNCPQNWAQVLFWREIVGSLCKTLQEHTISCVVHVHREKHNKNWGTELFTRLEICSHANVLRQGRFITFLYSWSAGAWSGGRQKQGPLSFHTNLLVGERLSPVTGKNGHFSLKSYRRNSLRRASE